MPPPGEHDAPLTGLLHRNDPGLRGEAILLAAFIGSAIGMAVGGVAGYALGRAGGLGGIITGGIVGNPPPRGARFEEATGGGLAPVSPANPSSEP